MCAPKTNNPKTCIKWSAQFIDQWADASFYKPQRKGKGFLLVREFAQTPKMVAQLFMEANALKMGLAWPYVNLHRHGDWKDTETFSRSDHFVTCICFLLRTKTLSYLKFSLHPNIVQISNYVMPSIAGRNASLQATRTWCALVKSENSGDIAPSICFKINKKVRLFTF